MPKKTTTAEDNYDREVRNLLLRFELSITTAGVR